MRDGRSARNELSPAGDRERNIASDLNDFSWMDGIDGSDGAIFFAAGAFHYFTFAQAEALIQELAWRFGGGRAVFDSVGNLGKKFMRASFKEFSMGNYDECLFVEDVSDIAAWVPTAHVTSRGYMLGYHRLDDPAVTRLYRFLARRCDGMTKMRIVRFDFA